MGVTCLGMGGMTGGMLTLSSNGKTPDTGVVWSTAPIEMRRGRMRMRLDRGGLSNNHPQQSGS
jgi:hypothetical protein